MPPKKAHPTPLVRPLPRRSRQRSTHPLSRPESRPGGLQHPSASRYSLQRFASGARFASRSGRVVGSCFITLHQRSPAPPRALGWPSTTSDSRPPKPACPSSAAGGFPPHLAPATLCSTCTARMATWAMLSMHWLACTQRASTRSPSIFAATGTANSSAPARPIGEKIPGGRSNT